MHRATKLSSVFACGVALARAMTSVEGRTAFATVQEASPAVCPVTTEAENEAMARRWFEDAINGGDLSVLDEILAPDVVHHAGTFPDTEGPDGIKDVLSALLSGFPDTRHAVEQVIANDDDVAVRWQAEGTHEGALQGHAPTGKPVTWTGINIFRIECGRIAESGSEVDGLGRLVQLELIATPVS